MHQFKAAKEGAKFRLVTTEEAVLDETELQGRLAERKQHLGMLQRQKQHILELEAALLQEIADCDGLLGSKV